MVCSMHSKRIFPKALMSLIMSIMTKILESYNAATPNQRFTSRDFSCHYLKTHLLSVYVSFYHLTTFQLPHPYSTYFLDIIMWVMSMLNILVRENMVFLRITSFGIRKLWLGDFRKSSNKRAYWSNTES